MADPILSTIEVHRLLAAFEVHRVAFAAAGDDAVESAAWAMLKAKPISVAGLVALLDYVNGLADDKLPARFAVDLLRFVAEELKRLSGLGGACPHCGSEGRGASFSSCCGVPV